MLPPLPRSSGSAGTSVVLSRTSVERLQYTITTTIGQPHCQNEDWRKHCWTNGAMSTQISSESLWEWHEMKSCPWNMQVHWNSSDYWFRSFDCVAWNIKLWDDYELNEKRKLGSERLELLLWDQKRVSGFLHVLITMVLKKKVQVFNKIRW